MSDKIRRWVEEHLDVKMISGDEAQALCVFHADTNPSMYVNVDKGVFTCFSCGEGGSVRRIAEQLDIPSPLDPASASVPTCKVARVPDRNWAAEIHRQLQVIALDEIRPKLGGLISAPERELGVFTPWHPYWLSRGISFEVQEQFGLGYDVMHDAITIPLRSIGGWYLGVVRRHLGPDSEPRYRYPLGFQKQLVLWGAHEAKLHHEVVITEGSLDAMRCWSLGLPAVAVLGSELSTQQSALLASLGCRRYWAAGDGDKAGRRLNGQLKAALGPLCRVVTMPNGEDPGSVSPEILMAQVS